MSSENPVIATQGLTRSFGDTVAVRDLTLEVYTGEIFGFLGHNGAGKTTTVRLLNGVLASNAGTTRVMDLDPLHDGPQLRQHTGVLTETPSLDERLTGREELTIYADLYGVPEAQVDTRVAELLESFGLAERGDDLIGEYSKGMKQRLAIARALLHDPQILFLDEPTAGLDPIATRQVHDLVREVSRKRSHTVFLCTHNLAEAQKLCHRVGVMEHGRLVALGTPTELARDLWKGVHLEIEVAPENLEGAVKALHSLPGVQEASPSEEKPVIAAKVAERESVPALVKALVDAGVRLYRLTPREPTLEDVYFALHGEEVEP